MPQENKRLGGREKINRSRVSDCRRGGENPSSWRACGPPAKKTRGIPRSEDSARNDGLRLVGSFERKSPAAGKKFRSLRV